MAESTSTTAGMRRKPRQARSQERVKRILDIAEELFITGGYTATTTNEIAARAQVPIGSLYQFFPDKAAILQALAIRYGELLRHQLAQLDRAELAALPLSVYVDQMINLTDQFFTEHPGYHAIFMEVQGTMPELEQIEQMADTQLIQDLATSLAQRGAGLAPVNYETIAFVLVKAIGTLLWLSLSQDKPTQQRLVTETKRLTLHYLQSYFSSEANII
jgi:AcrR family transcriptional regulator